MKFSIGLERLLSDTRLQNQIKGNIAILCHSATITRDFQHAIPQLKKVFGERLKKIYGPQHGFVTDVQDNMVETEHSFHEHYQLPIYSLYSETREPTSDMLDDIDHVLVDLMDVGTRVYTYQSTMLYLMKACGERGIKVTILDRPNPIGLNIYEGNVLEPEWKSFVGRLAIPQRHGLSMGELARFGNTFDEYQCDLDVITVSDLKRHHTALDIGFPYVNPSPNLPTIEGCFTFAGTVLFEGCNISEGRGTTRSLEVFGHPKLDPYAFLASIDSELQATGLKGFALRPVHFFPMFQKHAGKACGGIHIHPTNASEFKSWQLVQFLCQKLYHFLGEDFAWIDTPYEYEYDRLAIDFINGSERVREWIENNEPFENLLEFETQSQKSFIDQRKVIALY